MKVFDIKLIFGAVILDDIIGGGREIKGGGRRNKPELLREFMGMMTAKATREHTLQHCHSGSSWTQHD